LKETERKKERQGGGHILRGVTEKLAALKIPRHYPHVLLINVKRNEGKALGTEEGKVSGI
jgi:hypothetical protein